MSKVKEVQEKKVMMTAEQQRIESLVQTADKDGPVIENLEELFTRQEMVIPANIKKPEFSYRLIAKDNLDKNLTKFGGIYEIVTRSNHSHIPDGFFGIHGAYEYGNELILCFTRKSITDIIEKRTVQEFNFKADAAIDNISKSFSGADGKEAVRIERVEDPGDGAMTEELTEKYDFGSPG